MSASVGCEVTLRGPALWARIDRPAAGNACSSTVLAALEQWVARAREPEVRVLVLTGTGSTFCSGADLDEATALLADPPALKRFLDRGRSLVRSIRQAQVPTIAAVNGKAFGGGLELLLACDIAVASSSARMGDRHVAVGQVPGWGSSVMLPLAVGPALARRLLLTGEVWTAAEAERRGMVSEVVPAHELDGHVEDLAQRIAALDVDAMQRMLRVARPVDHEAPWAAEAAALAEHVAAQTVNSPGSPPKALWRGRSAAHID